MPDSDQSRLARLEQRVDDMLHRLDRGEDTQRAFANETGARIKVETELAGDLKAVAKDVAGELKAIVKDIEALEEWQGEMEDQLRQNRRFKVTTYLAVGALVCTASGVVVSVIALVH
jgi:hypothetical protein